MLAVSPLLHVIEGFARRANANAHVRRLARDWQTQIYVEATDSSDCYCMQLADGLITGVERAPVPLHETLLLRGRGPLLAAVFGGQLHPLNAFNDGDLEIYGSQPDQVKLDAISLLIWGA
jgi:hypothetical protein